MHGTNPPGDRVMSIDRQDDDRVGRSAGIGGVDDAIDRAARSDGGVLVTGEAGAGKALVARLIHQRSARAGAPMVALTCAGLPDWLLESDLFGHVRGGFTGAWRDKPGMLEMAPNGTLFLDDVGALGSRMQIALVRFLQSGDVQRLGADRAHLRVDVRVIAGTRPDLWARVESGVFREDLYAGLAAIHVVLPPLREGKDDIPPVVRLSDLLPAVPGINLPGVSPGARAARAATAFRLGAERRGSASPGTCAPTTAQQPRNRGGRNLRRS